MYLRGKVRIDFLLSQLPDDTLVLRRDQTGGMKDTPQYTPARLQLPEHAGHLRRVRNVRFEHDHFTVGLCHTLQPADLPADFVILRMGCEPAVPRLRGRKCAPRYEGYFRSIALREHVREGEPDTAQTTRDQIRASAPEYIVIGRHLT